MIASIHQPNYFPWGGLIQKIILSDVFIVFDDVQLPRGKNYVIRTKIKTSGGPKWITIPITKKSDFLPIKEVKINNEINWREQHWNKIEENYKNSPFFNEVQQDLKNSIYQKYEYLHEQNLELIKTILDILQIKRKIYRSSEFEIKSSGTQKIIDLLKKVKANEYITGSGEGSNRYVLNNKSIFEEKGLKIKIQNYVELKYPQLHGDFVSNLSIIDMIFNIGSKETLKKLNLNNNK